MSNKLSELGKEKSTYIITCLFLDEDGDAVIPITINWSLTTVNGTVINSRDEIAVGTPDSSIDIVLTGDDLAILTNETNRKRVPRKLIIEATYNSSVGAGLGLKDSTVFDLENLVKVT
jgi:hypothetical protein